MGLVKKLILGGTVYGVAREFNKNRQSEQSSRQAAEPYPPQPAYYAPPPAYEQQYQPAPSHYKQPRQNWNEKR